MYVEVSLEGEECVTTTSKIGSTYQNLMMILKRWDKWVYIPNIPSDQTSLTN